MVLAGFLLRLLFRQLIEKRLRAASYNGLRLPCIVLVPSSLPFVFACVLVLVRDCGW